MTEEKKCKFDPVKCKVGVPQEYTTVEGDQIIINLDAPGLQEACMEAIKHGEAMKKSQ